MTPRSRNPLRDLRGIGRLSVDATLGVVDLVEALHARIARTPVRLTGPVGRAVHEVTGQVYRTVRGVAGAVGGGLDAVLGRLVPLVGNVPDTPAREALVAALNGVLGDYLADSANPLVIGMRLRRDGAGLDLERDALAARIPRPASTILVAVHGLCMNDRQWARAGHDHAAALARDLGATAVYLHYNSGRHVSVNGQAFAALLEALVEAWPVPPRRLIVVGHSMGGLVARSAAHHGTLLGHRWRGLLESLVFLGVPHHGSPLERGGQGLHLLLEALPYVAPFARLARLRSAGITDLRHGSVLDDDWRGRDRFSRRPFVRHPLPLPVDVDAYAIAASLADRVRGDGRGMRGDGLVPVASALGLDADPRLALAFPASHRWIATSTGHLDLLSSTAVCDRVLAWLAESKRSRGTPRGRSN